MKYIILTFSILFFGQVAFAQVLFTESPFWIDLPLKGTSVIPNPYKTKREGHFTGSAAVFQNAKRAGVDVTSFNTKEQSDGSTDQKNDYFGYAPFLQLQNGKGSVEVRYTKADDEDDDTTTKDEHKLKFLELRGGLALKPDLAIGLTITKYDYEFDNGGNFDQDVQGINFVRKLDNTRYVGGGILIAEAGTPTDEDEYFSIGYGRVFGDTYSPDRAGELVFNYYNEEGTKLYQLVAKGVKNEGSREKSIEAQILRIQGRPSTSSKILLVNIGLDQTHLEKSYWATKAGYYYADARESHGYGWLLQGEIGQRFNGNEMYFQIRFQPEYSHTSGPNAERENDEKTTFTVGYNTSF